MEKDSIKNTKIKNQNNNGIKVLADQMAKKMFVFDVEENSKINLSQEQIIKLLLTLREKETEAQNNKSNDNEDIPKLNRNQEIISNINTNVNTKENNQNTIINTIANTGSIINTNNENEFGSNLNSKRSKVSLIDELINEYKINPTEDKMDKSIEKEQSDNINYTFDDESFSDNINVTTVSSKIKKTKNKKNTIYDRCIHDRKVKQVKLEKKRKEYEIKTLKQLTPHPEINPLTEKYLENVGYIPIEERAKKIQNMKLMKLCIDEQRLNHKEQKDMEEIKKHKYKKFDKYDWNKFINRQKKWKKNLQHKKKAAIILKNNEEDEMFFKPKINSRSKSIIEGIGEEHKNYIDDVFDRLYNDYDEHIERQKYRNQQSIPSFKPKIIKCNSQKNIGYDLKKINRYESNPLIYLNKKNYTKKSYNFNNSMDKKHELFIDSCKNFQNLMKRNKNFNNNYMKFINKSQQTNQQTNNNFSNINCSQASSGLINSNYIILDNQKKNEKSKKNSTAPFLPLNIKKMIEKNCEEEEELENINRISKQNLEKEKYKLNYSLYNMEESKEKFKNDKYNESELDSLYAGTERFTKNEINRNENSLNINNSELISQKEKEKEQERILEELEKAKKIIPKIKGDSLSSESNRYENNTYKINIRDSTPMLVKEDKILASKNYSDFFDIPDLEKDI